MVTILRVERDLRSSQSGFTLLEVLISLVIIMIGLFGLISVQTAGISSTKASVDRSLASIHVSGLLARMSVNESYWQTIPDNFEIRIDANGNVVDLGTSEAGDDLGSAVADCSKTQCDAVETASYDLRTWATDDTAGAAGGGFADRLPAAAAEIRRIGNDVPVLLEVSIQWSEIRKVSGVKMHEDFQTRGNNARHNTRFIRYSVRARP